MSDRSRTGIRSMAGMSCSDRANRSFRRIESFPGVRLAASSIDRRGQSQQARVDPQACLICRWGIDAEANLFSVLREFNDAALGRESLRLADGERVGAREVVEDLGDAGVLG